MIAVNRLRRPAVAGYFYPQEEAELRACLGRLIEPAATRTAARAALLPHAALRFAGSVTGATVSQIEIPSVCVLLGANHTAQGARWSVMADGAYQTPLGVVPVAETLAGRLLEACPQLRPDAAAHRGEHAIEVPLVFLQWLRSADLTIVPIVVAGCEPAECEEVGQAIGRALAAGQDERVLVIASSDLSHYEARELAIQKDARLIEAMLSADAARFLREARQLDAAVCGEGAIACLLAALQGLGASRGWLTRYGTSADAGGDPNSAVGYAGIIFN
jgi:AmmeMemoRadiSam system protein B